MKQPIELRKIRDFGQLISDSFTFLKENFKPLFKALFIICGFFILLGSVSTIFTYLNMSSIFTYNVNAYDARSKVVSFGITTLINAFVLILTQAFIFLVTLCYISVYVEKKNTTPHLPEVWGYFKYYFFRVLGSSILIFLLVAAGFVACLIPGIYLSVVFYFLIPIIVIENGSFSYAFNKSFKLIKGNWWLVFGVIFIMSLVVGLASSIASIPVTVITLGSRFFTNRSITVPLIVIFSILKSILLLLYVLPAIAVSLCYLSISEEKEGTGLLNRIERFGNRGPGDNNLPAEEY